MTRIKHAEVGLFIFSIIASGVALAECPHTMPEQLLEDCLIYQNEGESFPADDYAHMDQYQEWLKTQQAKLQPNTAAEPKTKNIVTAQMGKSITPRP